jgi:hypothetical protein
MEKVDLAFQDYIQALVLNPDSELYKDRLKNLVNKYDQSQLLNLIFTLSDLKQIKLLNQCLDKNTIPGEKFNDDESLLIKINERLSLLTKRLDICTFLLGNAFYFNQSMPIEVSLIITSNILQLSGLEIKNMDACKTKLTHCQMIMFRQPTIQEVEQTAELQPEATLNSLASKK